MHVMIFFAKNTARWPGNILHAANGKKFFLNKKMETPLRESPFFIVLLSISAADPA